MSQTTEDELQTSAVTQEDFVITIPGDESKLDASSIRQTPAKTIHDVLVVLRGDEKMDAEVVRIACSVARPTHCSIVALYGIEIPRSERLEAHLPEIDARAEQVIEHAKQTARRCDYSIEPEVVKVRSFAHTIVEESNAGQCTLLVMGMPYREKQGRTGALDEMVSYVLENATCRVWLVRGAQTTCQH
jgi:nucleotide-binding universal stress UspA family protein